MIKVEPKVRKVAIPRSQLPKKAVKSDRAKTRESLDCVEIALPARKIIQSKAIDSEVIDLTSDLSSLDIGSSHTKTSAPLRSDTSTVDGLQSLLSSCSNTAIQPFAEFLFSSTILNLVPGRAQPEITKIGEASYSEVYSVSRGRDQVVIKVVPLSPACATQLGIDPPDCSDPAEVKREVEITKRLSGLGEGGFIEYKG